MDATHHILGELEKEHKAHKAPQGADALKPDADADELREKFRIVRVSETRRLLRLLDMKLTFSLQLPDAWRA